MVMRPRHGQLAVALAWFLQQGCSEAVDNPAAFESELYLCDPGLAADYAARVEDCVAANSAGGRCGGVMSFRGQIEGLPVKVDCDLAPTEFSDVDADDGTRRRDDMKLFGRSPYFQFQYQWKEVGGDLEGGGGDRVLQFGAPQDEELALYDDRVRPSLRLSVGGDSRDFSLRSGTMRIDTQSPTEEVGSFDTVINPQGDWLEGCFHAVASGGDS